MHSKFSPNVINEKVQAEIDYFIKDEPALKADIEYVYKIGVPDRPKAYLMLQFAKALDVDQERVMPFVIVADLMMAAAMNSDDIIDANNERCGEPALWKIKGVHSTVIVTDYMYALIFSILKRYRPDPSSDDFKAYQRSENLLVDYFRVMNVAQYKTTISANLLARFSLEDLENLAKEKASLLFQFCSSVPAYFANKFIRGSEDFGYQLGIVRQYVSDVHDFWEVPSEEDYNKKGVSGDRARMEDYFTHQPNLVLVLTGTSDKLDPEERSWFYENWIAAVSEKDRSTVTKRVIELVHKTSAIEESKTVLRKIRDKIRESLSEFPDEDFKKSMSEWAFRSFPID